ncbi:sodium:solute symporter [Acidithiobacillus sp. CV18-2]|uniref:Sodium:solute symporter n=1 Tax=Igneacidithiobacillus copahuensis TaxID=2724909 RepID=A0AAE2YSB4_9PROT|nr:sodium:solute symporter [Igneacidithiobacillus copahuensis]MBU2753841.1 sodium:solute symporter [Acidithiobacillus sp. CV18-3]MBU2756603.1 sodium:solute symporter [Acidithiobacillus sp. BN09-2]MBU2777445.1 sodium:solute symporter [Acidithiobacillus sp. CV18-2]MBU2796193.1 sodium:solute symporter [Acidithiobacillus sp. VAN18-2]MBU2799862.1 sodium:solute symporter [Acidithiobacillus sp. VAN18-4]UTV82167.1 sodium:solute symporter [Acidithiobacillus sp. YTS05]
MHITATIVFVALFVLIAVLGFLSARWQRGDLGHLHEWGLGGRRFGNWITWFLIGGDLYTAYTFVAVPALVFGAGALGFFALPYTVLVYPLVFSVLPRLWVIAKHHNFITAADFVAARYDSPALALVIALTGIVATMPYIALQLVGVEVVIGGLGFPSHGIVGELPLIIAFVVLAAFTYTSGLRAPASIAVVKDLLVYITVLALIIVVPWKLGGFGKIFAAVPAEHLYLPPIHSGNFGTQSFYLTLALGSALALMLYPHATTAVLSAKGPKTLRRNWIFLPAYSFVLGLIALLGYMAYAANLPDNPALAPYFHRYGPQFAMPGLLLRYFPDYFVGIGFAAVAIGALVPAAIMSIAAANLFTRNIYRAYLRPDCDARRETQMAKLVSLMVKFGALLFILLLPTHFAIQLQLLGGILILQTLPAIVSGIYTRWFDPRALLIAWAIALGWAIWAASLTGFQKSGYALHFFGWTIPGYIGLYALLLNFLFAILITLLLRAIGRHSSADLTDAAAYQE